MKLLLCPACGDVRALHVTCLTKCMCGASSGRYNPDGYTAVLFGKAIPLGFTNSSFREAIKNRPQSGQGSEFVAFVIPFHSTSIKKEDA